jgi:hypothetical protein
VTILQRRVTARRCRSMLCRRVFTGLCRRSDEKFRGTSRRRLAGLV